MTKKVEKIIERTVIDERSFGHTICDFDDRKHDLREISEIIEIDMSYDEDKDEWVFQSEKDEEKANEALNYYYELHGC